MREEVIEKLKEVLENKIEEIKKLEPKTLTEEQKKNLADLEKDKAELDQLLEERKKYKEQIEYNKKNKVKPSQKNNPSYKLQPINKKLEEMLKKYDIENLMGKEKAEKEQKAKDEKTGEKENKQEQPSKNQQLADLEKQLKESAERMKAYRDGGFYAQEAGEHSTYNEILRKINELKAKEIGKETGKNEKTEQKEKKNQPIKVARKQENFKWHPDLTQEQIEELIAEGLDPRDQEYNQYLMQHGIDPNKYKDKEQNNKEPIKWHPDLTQEQIDELMAEGLEPGDQEYNQYLMQHGIDPNKYKDKEQNNKEPIKWHPDLTQEQIEELIAEGLDPRDQEYNQYLMEHGIDPNKYKDKNPTGKEGEGQTPPPGPTGKEGEGQTPPPGPGGKEGEGQTPPPGPGGKEGEGQTPPPGPGGKEGEGEGQNPPPGNNKNLPVRSFWEIYNDTCTEHVGSIAHTINKLAHMKILPAKQEDTAHKILSGILVLFKAPTKLVAKLPNAIMGTDKKIKEMQENIDNLPLEEFQVLVQSPEKVNSMFNAHVKDTFDRDYLDPQFMKQYKVNGAYLDTVRSRLGRERGAAIDYYTQQADAAHERMQELDEVGKQNWTPEQANEYNQMVEIYQQSVDEGKKFQGELDTFDEGAKKKSSSYRNISGWFLAKFNPDNREENAQMAGLSKARREMARQGNRTEVNAITGQMQQLARDNTDLKGGQKNYIDRGQYSIESPVEALDRGPQTKGRLLLTNIAVLSSAAGLFKQISDNRINREAVEAHNQHLQGVNQQNQNIQVNGQAKVADSPTAPQAEEAISRQTVEAGWNRAERGDLDATGWRMDSAYHVRDAQSHADGAQAAATTDSYLQQGDNLGALKTATDYYTKVQGANRSDIANYMSTHSQHDYTAFTFGDSADMSKVYDFFAKGVVPYSTNVNGVMAEMMPALKEGLDLNGVIFAGANALYQGQREGIKDLRKQVKVTPRRQEEPEQEEEQEQENQQNNHEHEDGGR